MNKTIKEKLKQKHRNNLWSDLKDDRERYEFLVCGRAHQTGIIAPPLAKDMAKLYLISITKNKINLKNATLNMEKLVPLFNYMSEQHNLNLTDGEMYDIIHEVNNLI